MEEAQSNQFNSGYGGNAGAINVAAKPEETRPQYSMPGILQFLQTEWAKFEMDRAQWEVERAELQVICAVAAIVWIDEIHVSIEFIA